VRRMREGELHQIQKSRKLDMDEESYLRIIGDKTASLLATCCEIGATSVSNDPDKARLMREYGENVGIAFQIRDDMLDFTGRKSITGKPAGLDLSEKKLTLPLIFAFRQAPKGERQEILSMIKNGGKKMRVSTIVDFVKRYGGLDYAAQRARHFATVAGEKLAPFPDSPSKTSLAEFARFVVDREK